MGERRAALRQLGRIVAGLLLMGVAGFLLGSCASDDGTALTTGATRTVTRPTATGTLSLPTQTATTTVTGPGTTEPPRTVTTVETETETETETRSVPILPATTTTAPTTTEAAAEPTSSSDTPWGWIALGAALAAALLIGFVLWRRRRARAASWSSELADLTQRSLVALDDVLVDGSVVTGRIQALAAEAQALETRATDDAARATAAPLRARLDDLAETLETDRTLRLGSPPPSSEQISYSTAVIRRQAEQLQGALRPSRTQSPN